MRFDDVDLEQDLKVFCSNNPTYTDLACFVRERSEDQTRRVIGDIVSRINGLRNPFGVSQEVVEALNTLEHQIRQLMGD